MKEPVLPGAGVQQGHPQVQVPFPHGTGHAEEGGHPAARGQSHQVGRIPQGLPGKLPLRPGEGEPVPHPGLFHQIPAEQALGLDGQPVQPLAGLARAGHEGVGAAHRAALHQSGEGQMLPGQEGRQFALAGLLVRPQPEGLAVLPLGLDFFHHHMLPGRVEQPGQAQGLLPALGVLCPGQGLAAPGRLAFIQAPFLKQVAAHTEFFLIHRAASSLFARASPAASRPSARAVSSQKAPLPWPQSRSPGRGQSSSSSRSRKGGGQAGASCQSTSP